MKVFISYSSKDRDFVIRLARELESHNIEAWYDQQEIKVGNSIPEKINEGLSNSDYLILVLSENSILSNWVSREANSTIFKEVNHRKNIILPALLNDTEIPYLLADKLFADFRSDFEHGLNQLLDAMAVSGGLECKQDLKILDVSHLVDENEKSFSLDVVIGNASLQRAWFREAKLSANFSNYGAGYAPYFTKAIFHINLKSNARAMIKEEGGDTLIPGLMRAEDDVFSESIEGMASVINKDNQDNYKITFSLPCRFFCPPKENVVLRLVFHRPEKTLLVMENEGSVIANSRFGGSGSSHIELKTYDGTCITHESENVSIIEFLLNLSDDKELEEVKREGIFSGLIKKFSGFLNSKEEAGKGL